MIAAFTTKVSGEPGGGTEVSVTSHKDAMYVDDFYVIKSIHSADDHPL